MRLCLRVPGCICVASLTFSCFLAPANAQAQTETSPALKLRIDRLLLLHKQEIKSESSTSEVEPSSMAEVFSCRELTTQALSSLTLMDAVGHVLCKNPVLNQSLLLVDEQQAGVDLARSAYRPRFSARAELSARGIPSSNSGAGFLNSSATGSLGLTWVIFDSGARDAALGQSQQVLSSAKSAQQSVALNTMNEALRLYAEAAIAFARLDALHGTERVARQSLQVAQAKYDAQVAALSEKLQAQTALAQATLERVRADGAWETARGLLALGMGFPSNHELKLAPVLTAFPGSTLALPIADMLESVKRQHPRLRSARADVLALKSRLDTIRAEYNGTVALSMGAGSTRDLSSSVSRFQSTLSGNVIASIPIFNGAEQQAREGQVLAQIASREETLVQIERDLEAEIWRNAKLLDTEMQNMEAAKLLLNAAAQSYQITFGRYKAGVGSILELIATQSSLSTAQSQLAQAQISLAQARLRFEVVSGRMLLGK